MVQYRDTHSYFGIYFSFIAISLWTLYGLRLIETRMFSFKTALKSILKCSYLINKDGWMDGWMDINK